MSPVVDHTQWFEIPGRFHPPLEVLVVLQMEPELFVDLLQVHPILLRELDMGVVKLDAPLAIIVTYDTLEETLAAHPRLNLLEQVVVWIGRPGRMLWHVYH